GRGEEGPLASLLALAKHKDVPVRIATAQLLAEGKLEGAIPALELLCADESEKVRRAAVVALGRSEASVAGASLIKVARHLDQDPVVRKNYAAGFLDAMEQGTLDPKLRNDARALVATALEHEFKDATLSERRAQAATLARFGDRGTLLRIATAAIATSELPVDSRRAAIEMLGFFQKNEAVESALAGLVNDPALGDDACVVLARMRKESFFEPAWRERLAPAVPYR
ncbi:MAG: HEAT repeat domain-containing protein, partial [Planctomycetota bacterium]